MFNQQYNFQYNSSGSVLTANVVSTTKTRTITKPKLKIEVSTVSRTISHTHVVAIGKLRPAELNSRTYTRTHTSGYATEYIDYETDIQILDADDRIIATLSNRTPESCPFWEALFREELNRSSRFEFVAPANHDDSKYIVVENQVAFKDKDGNYRLFVIKETDEIDGDNGPLIESYCRPAMYELNDTVIEDKRPQNVTAEQALQVALENTRWQVGQVDELGINSTNFYFMTATESLNRIANVWGAEIRDRVELGDDGIAGRYIDLLTRRGGDYGKRWEMDKDVESLIRQVRSYPKTALYGRGASLETEGGGFSRKLTFENVEWKVSNGDPVDKPLGQKWVGDPGALEIYGRKRDDIDLDEGTIQRLFANQENINPELLYHHRYGIFDDGNIEDEEELLWATWNELQERKRPFENYEMDVVLYAEKTGLLHEKVRLGDTTIAINRRFRRPIEVQQRVIALEYDISRPYDSGKVELGQFVELFSDDKRMDKMQAQLDSTQGKANHPEIDDSTFPDIKPDIPANFTADGLFKIIQLKWDFNASSYIAAYELYASQTPNFNPTSDRLVWRGKTGGYAFEADTNQQWYFRLRAVNTHGTASDYTSEVSASTLKINAGVDVEPYTITDQLIAQNAQIDGAKIADATITSAKIDELIGNLITAGIIKSQDGNVVFNLDDGILGIDDGAINITRPDGATWMQDGMVKSDFAISQYDPHFTTPKIYDLNGTESSMFDFTFDGWYTAPFAHLDGRSSSQVTDGFRNVRDSSLGNTIRFQRYEFLHAARYLQIGYELAGNGSGYQTGQHRVRIYEVGSPPSGYDPIYLSVTYPAGEKGIKLLVVDMGVPTYSVRRIDLRVGHNTSWGSADMFYRFRISSVVQTDNI